MGPLLALALIAGEPDIDWADAPSSAPAPEVSPAPAPPSVQPSAPAPAAESSLETALERPLSSSVRLTGEVGFGVSPSSMGSLGLGVELSWTPFPYVRLHAAAGAAYVPAQQYLGVFHHFGAMRILFGFDGVLPFNWGELFMGIDSGAASTNVVGFNYCYTYQSYCGGNYNDGSWNWQPSVRVRAGFDVTRLRPIIVGADVGYTLFPGQGFSYIEVHFAELHGRLGIAL